METISSAISSSLKTKLLHLEKTLDAIREEIVFQKREVATLKSEKETLDKVLQMKADDVKKSLIAEVNRVDSEMRDKFKNQKAENNKLQQQATTLKQEKTNLQQNVLALQRRIGELELQIGAGHH